ncbi:hypothetical protein BCR36DRAFT_157561 [Piromyces finnis]|uniref:Glycosyltransferase 2-like domain-containing protein n=1 Tax=Piromyces finnis TaxID=1754191 RepID=A0A1Y1UWT5_9FUNG|nr:hypothetical protein BCR36DRAFT_157561 [Piromyces finnis]|eukprot:ORX42567.1 hypothetical protein BCR36DRAFT_157561 [Piromyces finnis]
MFLFYFYFIRINLVRKNRVEAIYLEMDNGEGYSRNLGIEKAEGKYIDFVDRDDYVDPE